MRNDHPDSRDRLRLCLYGHRFCCWSLHSQRSPQTNLTRRQQQHQHQHTIRQESTWRPSTASSYCHAPNILRDSKMARASSPSLVTYKNEWTFGHHLPNWLFSNSSTNNVQLVICS